MIEVPISDWQEAEETYRWLVFFYTRSGDYCLYDQKKAHLRAFLDAQGKASKFKNRVSAAIAHQMFELIERANRLIHRVGHGEVSVLELMTVAREWEDLDLMLRDTWGRLKEVCNVTTKPGRI